MPMIEFRWLREKISDDNAQAIGAQLEGLLRDNITSVRPDKEAYGVTVEGDPFGLVAYNQPDLRVYVFYHEEWNFTPNERECLAAGMGVRLAVVLMDLKLGGMTGKIRFYSRTGYAGGSIS